MFVDYSESGNISSFMFLRTEWSRIWNSMGFFVISAFRRFSCWNRCILNWLKSWHHYRSNYQVWQRKRREREIQSSDGLTDKMKLAAQNMHVTNHRLLILIAPIILGNQARIHHIVFPSLFLCIQLWCWFNFCQTEISLQQF